MTQPNLVFLDTETTGLDRRRHAVWDIGLVLRQVDQPDQEHQFYVRPNLRTADPNGLRIGRYYDRMPIPFESGARYTYCTVGASTGPEHLGEWDAATMVAAMLDGAVVLGIVPDFDAAMLGKWLRRHNQAWTAHYQLVDVEALAAGRLQLTPPWSTDEILARFGLKFDELDRHTAIGDARMARDLYDRVMATETVFDYDQYGPVRCPVCGVAHGVDEPHNQDPTAPGATFYRGMLPIKPDNGPSWAGTGIERFEQGLTDPAPTVPVVASPHSWSTCSHGADYASEAEHDRECPALALSPSWEVPR